MIPENYGYKEGSDIEEGDITEVMMYFDECVVRLVSKNKHHKNTHDAKS